ncbi:MAG: Trp biosynthesis-associated membrane protein [Streptosporangiaceae bacterium]|jgi:uncharacterized membrane protein (TIGR02234 family)
MSGRTLALAGMSPRRELVALLAAGAAGAGLVLLSVRQGWATVSTAAPRPLPASVITVSGASLLPYADALAIAALACLAAVIATRRWLRRICGLLLAALGASLAVAVSAGVSRSAAIAAAAGTAGPATGAGAGTAAGSATQGSGQAGPVAPAVSGFAAHVAFHAGGWQAMAFAGCLAIIGAGLAIAWRAGMLPEMSSRYDSPAGAPAGAPAGSAGPASPASPAGPGRPPVADAATMWESLSRGEDPTSAGASVPAPPRPASEPS